MGRLTDKDALMDSLDNLCDMVCQYSKIQRNVMCSSCPLGDAFDVVDRAPTVDAVEVVRCRDCKWWAKDDNDPYGYCMAMKHGYISANWEIGIYRKYKGDFYCADGERMDEVKE